MALEFATITFDLSDQLGVDFDPRRTKVWVTTNAPDDTVIDQSGNKIRLGSGNVTVNPDGTGSLVVWKTGQTGLNPLSWQTSIHVDYPDRNERGGRGRRDFGPFTITTSLDLAVMVAEQEIPPTYLTTVTAQLDAKVDEAETAAALARDISNIDTTDTAVKTAFELPGSQSGAYLTATYAPRPITVDEMLAAHDFLVFGHRGGGKLVWPDGSLEGMVDAAQLGAHGVELDLRRLLGGGLAVMHDETVDRTSTGTGNTADYTLLSWRNVTLDPAAWAFPMPGWPNLKAPTWGDVLAQVAPLGTLLIPEVRNVDQAVADAGQVIRTTRAAGVDKSVIVQSFVWDACAAAVAAGVDAMYLDNAGTSHPPADLVNAGIRFLGADSAQITDATVAAMAAAGIHVIVWTLDFQSDADTWKAKGARGCFSDNPIYVARNFADYRLTKAPWTKNPSFYHGHLPYSLSAGFNPFKLDGTDYWFQPDTSGTFQFGGISPVADPTNYTLTVPMHLVATGSDANQWSGVYFGSTKDGKYVADVADGYLAMMRQNGTLQLYRRATGAANFTSLGSVTTAALTAGAKPVVRIVVNPAGVTVTRTDVAAPNSVTTTDTAVRGGYISLRDSGQNAAGRTARFGAITVT